jgi:acetylornithine deacetylase/succinyl-diaminopimelate desuccinylase-like protein
VLLASLHRPDGAVAIEGFYDKARPLEAWEREAWCRLPMTEAAFQAIAGAPALAVEAGYTAIEAVAGRPTAEINGLWGGYQGEGSKTVLPREAQAKLTFRLVPDQAPGEILQLVENHLRRHLPPGVKMAFSAGHGGLPYFVDPNAEHGRAAQKALRRVFGGAEPYLIREGGSIPIVCDFKAILGVDTILLGLALPTANMHSPDENFPVAHLRLGMDLNREMLREIGGP